MSKRVGILTGGGDVPGLNAAIKTFVWRMREAGYEVVGLRRGWAALLNILPFRDAEANGKWMLPLTRENTRIIDRSGGTVLHTSRINPAITKPDGIPEHLRGSAPPPGPDGKVDLTAAALETLEFLRLDTLVAIGGDGTLSFARRLHQEGVKIIGLPKTMDNDVFGTDYCIGFSTAVTRSVNFINDLRTAAGSHERYLVVELFGRNSGETCLLASYLAGTDRALIAEVPFDAEAVVGMMAEDKRSNPSNYAVAAISEGAYPVGGQPFESGEADAVGNRELGGVGRYLREELQKTTGDRVIYQRLGYLMRSGPPDSLDRLVASNFANLAADLILGDKSGRLVAIHGGRYASEPIETVGEGIKRVDVDKFYDTEQYRANIAGVMGLPMFLC
ncbi:MAG TPA: 6-phosphofructokinase [Thermoanaerobaculia bacterium]|jgi:6-phosphofructokinase 1|nr:6-phosphofructokinase [Thermoanaerobaculia bacterium]